MTVTKSAFLPPRASLLAISQSFRMRPATRRKSVGSLLDMEPELSMTMATLRSPLLDWALRSLQASSARGTRTPAETLDAQSSARSARPRMLARIAVTLGTEKVLDQGQ